MTKSPAERGHPLNIQQGRQRGQTPGRHDGQNGGEHDRPARQGSPHGMAHLWRYHRLDELVGPGRSGSQTRPSRKVRSTRDGGYDLVRCFGGERERQQGPQPLAAQAVDHRHQRADLSNGGGDGGRRGTEMLGQQPVAQPGDGTRQRPIECGVENEVALGIEAHGAIGEVGGANSRHLVIGNQHLRVDVEAVVAETGNRRIAEPQATVAIALRQPSQEPRPQDAHGALFEPTALLPREHGDNLRSVRLGEPSRQGGADSGRGQVLALDVNPAGRRRWRLRVGLEHLLHAGPVLGGGMVRAMPSGTSRTAGSTWRGQKSSAGAPVGGGSALPVPVRSAPARERRARRPPHPRPSPARRRWGAYGRPAGSTRRAIGRVVGRRIPTANGEVESSGKRQGVVDHDNLLVMRGPDGVGTVQLEYQPGMRAPGEPVGGQPLTLERIDERKVPAEGVHLELGAAGQGVIQQLEQREGRGAFRMAHRRPAVDVPADDENALACPLHRVTKRREIGVGIDYERRRGRPWPRAGRLSRNEHGINLSTFRREPLGRRSRGPSMLDWRAWIR